MKENCSWFWKVMILLTFILSITSSLIILKSEQSKVSYETRILELKDTNIFIDNIRVTEYICDENVSVNNYRDAFYATTWADARIKHSEGKCMIKIKVKK